MKKKIIITMLLSLCIACLSLFAAGCGDGADDKNTEGDGRGTIEDCEVVFEYTLYGGYGDRRDFIALCRSLDEFELVCSSNGYDFFDEGGSEDDLYHTEEGKAVRRLTDNDFADRVFVVCGFYRSSCPGQYRVKNIETENEKLTLHISSPRNETADDVECYMFLAAKLNKTLVADVTNLNYIIS